jgi:hypothetical protein
MRVMDIKGRVGQAMAAAGSAGALAIVIGCGGAARGVTAQAQPQAASQPGLPVVFWCEPTQRTVVRPAIVNGAAMSEVQCVAADAQSVVTAPVMAAPQAFAAPVAPAATPVVYRAPAPRASARDIEDTEIVSAPATTSAARPVRAGQTIYDERPVRRTRSVKKSAVIIGSSAGVGAGVGAAISGKKGALIGAAIGGGGAAVWDQITRRKD